MHFQGLDLFLELQDLALKLTHTFQFCAMMPFPAQAVALTVGRTFPLPWHASAQQRCHQREATEPKSPFVHDGRDDHSVHA